MLPFIYPFTAIMAGPTCCGKTRFVFRLIDNASSLISPPPAKIVYFYGEYQQLFNQYSHTEFHHGLPNIEEFDGKYPTLVIIDDLMQETNETVANMLRKVRTTETSASSSSPKTFSQKKVCANDESQCPLHGTVQESERRQSVCKSRKTDVSEDVPVCRRSV